ncbi:hypothetical protein [uncultured Campylobacter sp.]|uniref:hypothetical protein n=1 Tax=uncultured Campylobacter sp. TaxID=218934 RepID=UPI0026295BD8|nr:hypothetical protein [uncultured Campylobacter sp.]
MKNKTAIFLQLKEKMPSKFSSELNSLLDNASDEDIDKAVLLPYKNPLLTIILALALPGLDRIYLGQLLIGILKLIFVIFSYVMLNIGIEFDNDTLALFSLVLMLIALIVIIRDVFVVPTLIKLYNFNLIKNVLEKGIESDG